MKIQNFGSSKNIVGSKLKLLRENNNLSQKKLAIDLLTSEGLEWSDLTVLRAEAGTRFVSDIELKAIAHYFHVSSDYLIGLSDKP